MLNEGPEGVNWKLGLTFFEGWELGFFHWDWVFCIGNGIFPLGLGFFYWDWDKYFELWIAIFFFIHFRTL